LARIPDLASFEALKALVRDPVWFVRLRALDAWGELHPEEGGEIPLAALNDEVREVRYRAAFALRKIEGMKSEIVSQVLRTGSSLSFDSLLSEWDRAGFLDSVARDLADPGGARTNASKEFLRVLVAAGITSTLENFVLVYPNEEVRWALAKLLLEAPQREVRESLLSLARDPRCDTRIATTIMATGKARSAEKSFEAGAS
jgi:hypothetical protein